MSEFLDHVVEMLEPMGGIGTRKMFGGWCLYRHGVPIAIVADEALYFKVDDRNRADYEAAGSRPFTYTKQGKELTISNWEVPLEVLEDAGQLAAWAEKAYEVGLAAKKQPKKRR